MCMRSMDMQGLEAFSQEEHMIGNRDNLPERKPKEARRSQRKPVIETKAQTETADKKGKAAQNAKTEQ